MSDSRRKKENKRQTPVPLLNFVLLAAVTLTVLYPGYTKAVNRTTDEEQFTTCRANIDELHEAVETYRKAHKGALPKKLSDVVGGKKPILEKMPLCPAANAESKGEISYDTVKGYEVVQPSSGRSGAYTIRCAGHNHDEYCLRPNEPYYSTSRGLKPNDVDIGKRRELKGEK